MICVGLISISCQFKIILQNFPTPDPDARSPHLCTESVNAIDLPSNRSTPQKPPSTFSGGLLHGSPSALRPPTVMQEHQRLKVKIKFWNLPKEKSSREDAISSNLIHFVCNLLFIGTNRKIVTNHSDWLLACKVI